jgi:glutaredoxin
MLTRSIFSLSLILSIALFACSSSGSKCADGDLECFEEQNVNVVLVYGLYSCGTCMALKSDLEAKGIDHTFFDVDSDDQAADDMWNKMSVAHPGVQVSIPVVDVNGVILNGPSISQVEEHFWDKQQK